MKPFECLKGHQRRSGSAIELVEGTVLKRECAMCRGNLKGHNHKRESALCKGNFRGNNMKGTVRRVMATSVG